MFDSHCHLHDDRLWPNVDAILARARAVGVQGFLLAGVEPRGWLRQAALCARHADVVFAAGIHPQLVVGWSDDAIASALVALKQILADRPQGLVAVGEIGLDGGRAHRGALARQEALFRAQLALCDAHALPVVLHILDAHARALEILRECRPRFGGVLHSASAPAELIPAYLALGLHVSFAGTIANPAATRTHKAALAVPLDRLLVETDAPFQTPIALRPATNEPAFLVAIVAAFAQCSGRSVREVASAATNNARRLFLSKQ